MPALPASALSQLGSQELSAMSVQGDGEDTQVRLYCKSFVFFVPLFLLLLLFLPNSCFAFFLFLLWLMHLILLLFLFSATLAGARVATSYTSLCSVQVTSGCSDVMEREWSVLHVDGLCEGSNQVTSCQGAGG